MIVSLFYLFLDTIYIKIYGELPFLVSISFRKLLDCNISNNCSLHVSQNIEFSQDFHGNVPQTWDPVYTRPDIFENGDFSCNCSLQVSQNMEFSQDFHGNVPQTWDPVYTRPDIFENGDFSFRFGFRPPQCGIRKRSPECRFMKNGGLSYLCGRIR